MFDERSSGNQLCLHAEVTKDMESRATRAEQKRDIVRIASATTCQDKELAEQALEKRTCKKGHLFGGGQPKG